MNSPSIPPPPARAVSNSRAHDRHSVGTTGERSPLPPILNRVLWLTVVLTLFSVFYCFVAKRLFGDPLSHYFPLSPKETRFGDFTVYSDKFRFFHTPAFFTTGWPFTYPAPVAIIYETFYRLGAHAKTAFLLFSIIALLAPALWFGHALGRRLAPGTAWLMTSVLLCCSWPAILVLDRANMEIAVFVVLAFAVWAFCTGRGYTAAAAFGIAAALKLFPFVFLGLFLSTRRYRQLLAGVAVFACVSLAALWALGPTIPAAYNGITDGLLFFRTYYMAQWHTFENGVDHSLFAIIKSIMVFVFDHDRTDFSKSLSIYLVVTAIGGLALYAWRIRLLPLNNQILVFSIVSIFLTAFSGDGTLLHLYYPFAILTFLAIKAYRTGVTIRGLGSALTLLALVFAPLSFLNTPDQRFEGEVKGGALAILLVLALRFPFGTALAKRLPESQP